jgi:hypothetical protein
MAGVRFADLQSRPTEFLDFTSVTLDEFQQLVPPFEAAFQAHMAAGALGRPPSLRPAAHHPMHIKLRLSSWTCRVGRTGAVPREARHDAPVCSVLVRSGHSGTRGQDDQ